MKEKKNMLEDPGNREIHWHRVFKQKKACAGLVVVSIFIFLALFAPVIAPNDPLLVDVTHKLKGISGHFWLGTDHLGRCIASRLIWGSRNSLLYSGIVMVITILIGVPVGLISGYIGGKTDDFIMRVIDLFLAMPSFIVALAIAGTLGASGEHLILAMSCVYWAAYARFTRGLTIQIKEQSFIMALKAGGCTGRQILFGHILKNIAASIIVLATIEFGSVILSIASFSFIGLGVQPPAPEWGIMLSDSKNYIQTFPQLMLYPGLAIVIVVMAFNLLGDGIRHGMSAE